MIRPIGSCRPEPGKTVHGSLEVEGLALPVVISTGARPGPTLLVTCAQHAAEFSGLAAADAVLAGLDPAGLAGTLLVLPVVNPLHNRLEMDPAARPHARKEDNINRKWPGSDADVLARIARTVWEQAVVRADALLDFHCCRRVDPRFSAALAGHVPSEALAVALGLDAVDLQTPGTYAEGLLFMEAAARRNIPSVLIESHPDGFQVREAAEACAAALWRGMVHLGMLPSWEPPRRRAGRTPVFSRLVEGHGFNPKAGGYLGVRRWLGEPVEAGELVAVVRSLATFGVVEEIRAPVAGSLGCIGDPRSTGLIRPGECAGDVKPVEWR
ncbi:MAG TPA: succinylglutamate desuccinylase/aspartoacylase family protein [Planctomycetota bacterium]|nr:succinylglutamate desuccinylase/aspartoacylase family protein [Planctomycetota bacterium]